MGVIREWSSREREGVKRSRTLAWRASLRGYYSGHGCSSDRCARDGYRYGVVRDVQDGCKGSMALGFCTSERTLSARSSSRRNLPVMSSSIMRRGRKRRRRTARSLPNRAPDTIHAFECGTPSVITYAAQHESFRYIDRLGVSNIQSHAQRLIQRLRKELPERDYRCITPEGAGTPLITFRCRDTENVRQKIRIATTFG